MSVTLTLPLPASRSRIAPSRSACRIARPAGGCGGRGATGRGRDRVAAALVEQPQVLRRERERDRVADGRLSAGVEARDDRRAVRRERRQTLLVADRVDALATDAAVQDRLVAEELDDFDLHVDGRLGVALGEMERLGPDADDERPRRDPGDGDLERARLDAAIGGAAAEQVHRRAADERRDEHVRRRAVDLLRRAELQQVAAVHHGDAVAERHRLDLVVRDVDRRRRPQLVDLPQFGSQLCPELRVQVRQRLVEQEDLRAPGQRATHRDPLSLSAGQLCRLAVHELIEREQLAHLAHALADDLLVHLPLSQPERQVLRDRLVRIQRVVLEHHRDVAVLRGDAVHDALPDRDSAGGRLVQTRHHPERSGLAAARRSDEHQELTVLYQEVQRVDGGRAAREDLRDLVEGDLGHRAPSTSQPGRTTDRLRCRG
jgi:hypothetical protein